MDSKPAPTGFPTVLLLEVDPEWRAWISSVLRGQGYNILEAEGLPNALGIAKIHSRPIQLLVSGLHCDDIFMDRLQQLRPGMQLMQFTRDEIVQDPNSIPERVRLFFVPAREVRSAGNEESQTDRLASDPFRTLRAGAS